MTPSVWRAVASLPTWMRWLLLGQFVNATGSLMWIYLTLYLVQNRGLSLGMAGLVAGANGVGTIAGNLVGGSVADRFGIRRTALSCLALSSFACAAVPLVPTAGLAAVVGLRGLVGGATRPVLSALVAGELPAQRRREGIALSRSVLNAGTVIGPPLGAVIAAHAFGAVFVVDGLTGLMLTWLVFRFVPGEGAARSGVAASPGSLWSALRRDVALRRLLLGIVAVDTTYRLMYTVLPVQLAHRGVSPVAYGLLISLNCVLIVAAEAPIALALRERPAIPVIAGGFALVGAAYLLLGLDPGLLFAVLAVVVLTGGEMLYKPTATAHAADLAPAGMTARYQSAYGAASIAGTMLSPVLGGALYDAAPELVWPVAGVVAVAAGVLLYLRSSAEVPAAGSEEDSLTVPPGAGRPGRLPG
ncbi:MAG TPA: MFS transporter [Actinomycetes bacterium]